MSCRHRPFQVQIGLFEFIEKKYPKAKHRFALADARFMAIAGLWREGQGNQPASFTMLTTAPGPDVEPYQNRQVAVLQPKDWRPWIVLSAPEGVAEAAIRRRLAVEMVRPASA